MSDDQTKPTRCVCRFVLAILVIVFAWLKVSWAPIALTILGVLLALAAICGCCCCCCAPKSGQAEPEQTEQTE
jgi:hypothetical protein